MDWLTRPWPWYVAGPLLGLTVPALVLLGGKQLGVSANLGHLCAALLPRKPAFLRYDWRAERWNLAFAAGLVLGGLAGVTLLADPAPFRIADATRADLARIGVVHFDAMIPRDLLSWGALFTRRGLVILVGGGFLVGFGARWAGGCTSGHGVAGLADFQVASLLAVCGFFAGGLLAAHVLLGWVW
jgi:uncharacterized membrane protein YedE/YeeE